MKKEQQYTEAEYESVLGIMSDGSWHKAQYIAYTSFVTPRKIRQMSECTAKFISCNKGYKLAEKSTDEEKRRYVSSLRSRANKITLKANAIEANEVAK